MPEHAEHHSLLERAADFYHSALSDSTPATQYLSAHHLLVSDLTDHFTIGYCDSRLSEILPTDPKIREELLEAGILDATGSEILEGCLVLPVTDAEGAVKGLCGCDGARPKVSSFDLIERMPPLCAAAAEEAEQPSSQARDWSRPDRNRADLFAACEPVPGCDGARPKV